MARFVAEGGDAKKVRASALMSSPAVLVEPSMQMHEAVEIMRTRRVKRLVVALAGQVRGVLTVRDVAYAQPELARRYIDTLKSGWQD